jgi:Ala-tRNA(Pro) deacylase
MTIPARLKLHLDQNHIGYSPVVHEPARSSQYAASLLHVPGKQVAKTVVLRAGKQTLLAVIPASYHVNPNKLAAVMRVEVPVKLLEEEECYKLFPDCQPGAVPPFGELYGLPVYLDEALAEDPEIIFSAGTLSDGIRMGNVDFVHLVNPRICSFAEEGEVVGRAAWRNDPSLDYGGSE